MYVDPRLKPSLYLQIFVASFVTPTFASHCYSQEAHCKIALSNTSGALHLACRYCSDRRQLGTLSKSDSISAGCYWQLQLRLDFRAILRCSIVCPHFKGLVVVVAVDTNLDMA